MAPKRNHRRLAAAPQPPRAAAAPQPPRAAARHQPPRLAAPQPPPAAVAAPPGSPTLGWLRGFIQARKDLDKALKDFDDASELYWNPIARAASGLSKEEIDGKYVKTNDQFANAKGICQTVGREIASTLELRVETEEDVNGAISLCSFGFNGVLKVSPGNSHICHYAIEKGFQVAKM